MNRGRLYLLFSIIWMLGWHVCIAQGSGSGVACRVIEKTLLTHLLVPAGPLPTAFDPNGVYPYVSFSETSNRPVPVNYRHVVLENEHLAVTICPDLGGKITSMVIKPSQKEVLYVPEVIRPTRILPRFYFVAGGIEVSFPISHSPSQNEKVLYKVDRTTERIYVTCGERELRFGMQWSVEYSLGTNDTFLTQRVVLHNPGTLAYPWMSWSNAALPSAADTEFHFPSGRVLSHSSVLDTIDWKTRGPEREGDINEMTGYFWITRNVNAFGAFTPSLGSGLYHIGEEAISPGMKLWSYGRGRDSAWATLSSARQAPYIEIQGGPIGDQSVKLELKQEETRWHSEFWIPSVVPLDIVSLRIPDVELRPVDSIPLFDWAREDEILPWRKLQDAFRSHEKVPDPPDPAIMRWAPSGIEELGQPFEWAISNADPDQSDTWRLHYGAWMAGRGDAGAAILILSGCEHGIAKGLLGRLLRQNGDFTGALNAYRSIREPWLQIHPQVVVERDMALRTLGSESLTERAYWLDRVDALKDEWIIERRVQWLIDTGDASAARELLLSVPFQKVHQTYTRTGLWIQICESLGEESFPVPDQLGEDRLAGFGKYREFE